MMKRTWKRNRFLAVLLATAMLLSTVSISAGASGFSDISSTYSYLDSVNYVSDNKIMVGTGSNKFSPNNALTRAMAIQTIYNKAGSPSVTITNQFTDVPSSAWYAKAVSWGVAKGIVAGTSNTTFSPNATVTRQDAMVFLYRYANTVSSATNKPTSITGYSDYSSVSTYARPAMAWAIGNGVLELLSGKLAPKTITTRVQIAHAITKFGSNVERTRFGYDNYGFTNERAKFTAANYYTTNAHYQKLKAAFKTYGGDTYVSSLIDFLKKSWGGSCYGMSATVALDKNGKIAFNENYSSAKTMRGITNVKGSKAESAINYYHASQILIGHGSASGITSAMNACINADGPTMLSFWWGNGSGHTVLVNSCRSSGSSYTIEYYDPNCLEKVTATLTNTGVLTTSEDESLTLTNIRALNNYGGFNRIDIDGYTNNDISSSYSATYSTKIPMNDEVNMAASSNGLIDTAALGRPFSTLTVDLAGDFTIENSDGEVLEWTGAEFVGDMEIFNVRFITGNNTVASAQIDVPESTSFTFKSSVEGADLWFSVTDAYRYARVNGFGISTVTVNDIGEITLDGEQLDFDVAYSTPDENSLLYMSSGSGNGRVFIEGSNSGLIMNGIDESYTVEAFGCDGNSVSTITIDPETVE